MGIRHKRIYDTCKDLDYYVHKWRCHKKADYLPRTKVKAAFVLFFPNGKVLNKSGAFKDAYYIKTDGRELVLKFLHPRENRCEKLLEKRIARVPNLRRTFAKVHWHTRYFMLQKYGTARVTKEDVEHLKIIWKSHGFVDVKKDNVKMFGNKAMVIDALKSKRG